MYQGHTNSNISLFGSKTSIARTYQIVQPQRNHKSNQVLRTNTQIHATSPISSKRQRPLHLHIQNTLPNHHPKPTGRQPPHLALRIPNTQISSPQRETHNHTLTRLNQLLLKPAKDFRNTTSRDSNVELSNFCSSNSTGVFHGNGYGGDVVVEGCCAAFCSNTWCCARRSW
jgi:hypothetical protein